MTTEDLRITDTSLKSGEVSDFSSPESATAHNVAPRKMNRVSSMSFQNGGEAPTTVGQRLTVRRLELGLTQEQVASRVMLRPKSGKRQNSECPLSRTAYCMYERDLAAVSLKSAADLAKALDVSPSWLAWGIGEPGAKKAKKARAKARTPAAQRELIRRKFSAVSGE